MLDVMTWAAERYQECLLDSPQAEAARKYLGERKLTGATVRKFRTGLRGAHPDDAEGLRMRPMSRQMASELEVDTVSAYVAAMPAVRAAPTLEGGDAAAGATAYAVCAACHGANGMGNEQLKSPPIAGQADWYLLNSLKKFKAGIRGNVVGDVPGSQMRPMAATLPDEQAMKNVIAHIATLSGH